MKTVQRKRPFSGTRPFTAKMRSAAKTLRDVQARVSQLVHNDHPTFVGQQDTDVLFTEGCLVAAALDGLAERFDIAEV